MKAATGRPYMKEEGAAIREELRRQSTPPEGWPQYLLLQALFSLLLNVFFH
jgi:hypothetical protein